MFETIERLRVVLNLPKLTNISAAKEEILEENVPDCAVVKLMVMNDLFDRLLVNGVVVYYGHSFSHINHRQVAVPGLPVAQNRMPVLFNVRFFMACAPIICFHNRVCAFGGLYSREILFNFVTLHNLFHHCFEFFVLDFNFNYNFFCKLLFEYHKHLNEFGLE